MRKSIWVIAEKGVTPEDKGTVIEGIEDLLGIAEVHLQIEDKGAWRDHEFLDDSGVLVPRKSLDWFLKIAKDEQKKPHQFDAHVLASQMGYHWQVHEPDHYNAVILKSDMYMKGYNFVIGAGKADQCAVLSTFRFVGQKTRSACIKTEAMHEVGHMFGLPDDRRGIAIVDQIGGHCTNICVMRQGMRISDWARMSEDRERYGPLCRLCEKDLLKYFQKY